MLIVLTTTAALPDPVTVRLIRYPVAFATGLHHSRIPQLPIDPRLIVERFAGPASKAILVVGAEAVAMIADGAVGGGVVAIEGTSVAKHTADGIGSGGGSGSASDQPRITETQN
jgi:hypothetical protein